MAKQLNGMTLRSLCALCLLSLVPGGMAGAAEAAGAPARDDVQARLAQIEANLQHQRAPQWLPAPFDDAEAAAWVGRAAAAKVQAQQAIDQIQEIAATAQLPLTRGTVAQGAPYDRQDLNRLLGVANRTLRQVDEALDVTLRNLQAQFEAQDRELGYFRSLDPDNPTHRMNAFLREGAAEDIYGRLDRQAAMAESVAAYQRAFGREPTANTRARIQEIAQLRVAYAAGRARAIGDSRLPDAKSHDPERLAIARRILAEPRHEFGEHGPIVLTTGDIVEREKQVSRAEIKDVEFSLSGDITLTGTETTWNYRWREFKFATPIKETASGDWHVWWITAKNFSSGWERTPIGRWVPGDAVKGDLIPPENFSR
jgi:hypothetical protein